jgi:hypothetical protein
MLNTSGRLLSMTTAWRMIEPGHHVHAGSGLHVVRGIDDSDGYERILWAVWSGDPRDGGVPLSRQFAKIGEARRRAVGLAA